MPCTTPSEPTIRPGTYPPQKQETDWMTAAETAPTLPAVGAAPAAASSAVRSSDIPAGRISLKGHL